MASNDDLLAAPFPYFGGKSSVAAEVWQRFGRVPNYVEPFFGSGAMLLRRPAWTFTGGCDRETVNDYDGHVANFWRSIQRDPEATAAGADRLIHELDLHAVGDALFCRPCKDWNMSPTEFVQWMRADESHFDAARAGAWAWFLSNWIGGLPGVSADSPHKNADGVHKKLPHLGAARRGVSRQRPHLGDAGQGVSRQLPHLGDAGMGEPISECERRRNVLRLWFGRLADRLRNVRVCCGDWSRLTGKSLTWNNAAPCAVFLDPPYSAEAGRNNDLYSTECSKVAHDVRAWCLIEGRRDDMRIALCGYEGEHNELEAHGWSVWAWKAQGGYSNQGIDENGTPGRENRGRERVWFSPACLPGETRYALFDGETP